MNSVPVRILLVGEAKDACMLRGLLNAEDSSHFQIAHVTNLELAAERLSSEPADILLVGLPCGPGQSVTYVQAARSAAPDAPMIILADDDNESLAVEALRHGVQD